MITRWEIRPAPTEKAPLRYSLRLKAHPSDIQRIIREMGDVCGRPRKEKAPFTHFLFLNDLSPLKFQRVELLLKKLCPEGGSVLGRPQEAQAEEPPSGTAPPAPQVPAPDQRPGTIEAPEARDEPPAPAGPIEPPERGEAPGEPGPADSAGIVPSAESAEGPQVPAPAAAGTDEVPAPLQGPGTRLGGPGARGEVRDEARDESPAPAGPIEPLEKAEVPGEPGPAEPVAGAPEGGGVADRGKTEPRWDVVQPLSPDLTFKTLVVGAHNRFVHAASMSVIANMGAMYNPLLIHGKPGSGKTHVIGAIGTQVGGTAPAEEVFLTSGTRLSFAATAASKMGKTEDLKERLKKANLVLVDDIHLLLVTEENREILSDVLKFSISQGRQLVITSVYPPQALGALESSVDFPISQGYAVEVKVPKGDFFRDAVSKMAARRGIPLSDEELDALLSRVEKSLYEAVRWVGWLKSLRDSGRVEGTADMLDWVSPSMGKPAVPETEIEPAQHFRWPSGTPSKGRIGLLYPNGREREARFAFKRFFEACQEYGLEGCWEKVLTHAYDPNQVSGVPFVLGEVSNKGGLGAALVLGPEPGTGLADKVTEFDHAMRHILEAVSIRMGWIPFDCLGCPPVYLRAALDIMGGVPNV